VKGSERTGRTPTGSAGAGGSVHNVARKQREAAKRQARAARTQLCENARKRGSMAVLWAYHEPKAKEMAVKRRARRVRNQCAVARYAADMKVPRTDNRQRQHVAGAKAAGIRCVMKRVLRYASRIRIRVLTRFIRTRCPASFRRVACAAQRVVAASRSPNRLWR